MVNVEAAHDVSGWVTCMGFHPHKCASGVLLCSEMMSLHVYCSSAFRFSLSRVRRIAV